MKGQAFWPWKSVVELSWRRLFSIDYVEFCFVNHQSPFKSLPRALMYLPSLLSPLYLHPIQAPSTKGTHLPWAGTTFWYWVVLSSGPKWYQTRQLERAQWHLLSIRNISSRRHRCIIEVFVFIHPDLCCAAGITRGKKNNLELWFAFFLSESLLSSVAARKIPARWATILAVRHSIG